MKKIVLIMSCVAVAAVVAGCQNQGTGAQCVPDPQKQEREFLRDAIRHKSPDVQRVDIIDSTVVYTHIYDGIVDVKAYTYDGDVCVAAERVYTFPNQMSALRHYRDAVEKADLYEDIEMFNNQVRYKLKEGQHRIETKGLTKEQLKEKFDSQIAEAKADMKRNGENIERDMKAVDSKIKGHHHKHEKN